MNYTILSYLRTEICFTYINNHIVVTIKTAAMPSSPLSYEHHLLRSTPSMAPSLDYCRLPSHLGKSSELVCTRFCVSFLDILDLCFLEYHNVILSFNISSGGRLLSEKILIWLSGKAFIGICLFIFFLLLCQPIVHLYTNSIRLIA